jgi:hypothetical protein
VVVGAWLSGAGGFSWREFDVESFWAGVSFTETVVFSTLWDTERTVLDGEGGIEFSGASHSVGTGVRDFHSFLGSASDFGRKTEKIGIVDSSGHGADGVVLETGGIGGSEVKGVGTWEDTLVLDADVGSSEGGLAGSITADAFWFSGQIAGSAVSTVGVDFALDSD